MAENEMNNTSSTSSNNTNIQVSNDYQNFLSSMPSQATAPMRPITEGFSYNGTEKRDN